MNTARGLVTGWRTALLCAACVVVVWGRPAAAAAADESAAGDSSGTSGRSAAGRLPIEPPAIVERDLSGPRLGFMLAPGDGQVSRNLKDHGLGRIVSEFGWHFERQVSPAGGGPQFLSEAIPLIGGVEYGKFVPSLTVALGVRLPSGLEFGMGPSWTVVSTDARINSGLVIAVGKTIDYGGVHVPFNLAVSTNPKGTVFSITTGYAIHRSPY